MKKAAISSISTKGEEANASKQLELLCKQLDTAMELVQQSTGDMNKLVDDGKKWLIRSNKFFEKFDLSLEKLNEIERKLEEERKTEEEYKCEFKEMLLGAKDDVDEMMSFDSIAADACWKMTEIGTDTKNVRQSITMTHDMVDQVKTLERRINVIRRMLDAAEEDRQELQLMLQLGGELANMKVSIFNVVDALGKSTPLLQLVDDTVSTIRRVSVGLATQGLAPNVQAISGGVGQFYEENDMIVIPEMKTVETATKKAANRKISLDTWLSGSEISISDSSICSWYLSARSAQGNETPASSETSTAAPEACQQDFPVTSDFVHQADCELSSLAASMESLRTAVSDILGSANEECLCTAIQSS